MSPRSGRTVAFASLVVLVVAAAAIWWRSASPTGDVLVVAPSRLEFEATRAGEAVEATVMVSNLGDTPLPVEAIEVDAPFEAKPTLPEIGPGLTMPVSLVFRSDVRGSHEGTLRVSAGGHRQSVDLAAQVRGRPRLTLGVNGIDFGQVKVGGVALAQVTVGNEGDDVLEIGELLVMSVFEGEARSTSVGPGESTEIALRFRPPEAGPWRAALYLETNDPERPSHPISLRGIGVEDGVHPAIAVTPGNLDFGRVPVGARREGWLRIENQGFDPLTLTSVVFPPGFEGSARSRKIQPGRSVSIRMSFAPTRTGAYDGNVRVLSNDPGRGSVEVALRGNAVAVEGLAALTGRADDRRRGAGPDSPAGSGSDARGLEGLATARGAGAGPVDGEGFDFEAFDLDPVGAVPEDAVAAGDGESEGFEPPPPPELLDDSIVCMNTFCANIPSDAVGEFIVDRQNGVVELRDLDLPTIYAPAFETYDIQVTAGLGSIDVQEGTGEMLITVPIEFTDRFGNTNQTVVTLTSGTDTPLVWRGTALPPASGETDNGGVYTLVGAATFPHGGPLGGEAVRFEIHAKIN